MHHLGPTGGTVRVTAIESSRTELTHPLFSEWLFINTGPTLSSREGRQDVRNLYWRIWHPGTRDTDSRVTRSGAGTV